MLDLATLILGLTLAVGGVLAVLTLRARGAGAMGWKLAVLHGLLAVIGYGFLVAALAGPVRGERTGTASFGVVAAVALALAAAFGAAMVAIQWRRRPVPGGLVGVHATLAVTGFVILAVYAALG